MIIDPVGQTRFGLKHYNSITLMGKGNCVMLFETTHAYDETHRIGVIVVQGNLTDPECWFEHIRNENRIIRSKYDVRGTVIDAQHVECYFDNEVFSSAIADDHYPQGDLLMIHPTAVVLPTNESARRNIRSLHTILVNRGRISVREFYGFDVALKWLIVTAVA